VDEILRQYPELQFQQDEGKGQASAFTKSVIKAASIQIIEWLPCSLDLNPIETVWDDMKDYIQEYHPKVHSSYKNLREAVQEAWISITHERIRELVILHSIKEQCQAVIGADGWY